MMTYKIIPTAELTEEMVSYCVQRTMDLVRFSVDGTKAAVNFFGVCPACLVGVGTDYTNDEIVPILQSAEWGGPA